MIGGKMAGTLNVVFLMQLIIRSGGKLAADSHNLSPAAATAGVASLEVSGDSLAVKGDSVAVNNKLLQPELSADDRFASGCGSLSVECPIGSLMIVTQASFTPGWDCDITPPAKVESNWFIWESAVRRCNGYRIEPCTFNLGLELPETRTWGHGRVDLRFRCEEAVSSYCGGRVDLTEIGESSPADYLSYTKHYLGYLSSPGYPKYYLGGRECVWSLQAAAGQTISLQLWDISTQKEDCVIVVEDGKIQIEQCGDTSSPISYTSFSHLIELRMRTAAGRQRVFPRRGVLVSYSPLGCPHPPPVADGRLANLTETQARYECDEGHIFKSDFSPYKTLYCRLNRWSGEHEHCISVLFLLQYGNHTMQQALKLSHSHLTQKQPQSDEWSFEVGTTVAVGILLAMSLAVALVLYWRYREEESHYLEEDQLNLRESGSRQVIQDELERY